VDLFLYLHRLDWPKIWPPILNRKLWRVRISDLGSSGNFVSITKCAASSREGIFRIHRCGRRRFSGLAITGTSNAAATVRRSPACRLPDLLRRLSTSLVGGTDFNECRNPESILERDQQFNHGKQSALSYIPEVIWNDACTSNPVGGTSAGSTGPGDQLQQ